MRRKTSELDSVAAFLASHSYDYHVVSDCCVVAIPWYRRADDTRGVDWYAVTTLAATLDVLGY